MDMQKRTKHFQKRMSQRAINKSMVEATLELGIQINNGKVRLDRKTIKSVLTDLDNRRRVLDILRKTLLDAERKGGLVVVVGDDDVLVTTYSLGH